VWLTIAFALPPPPRRAIALATDHSRAIAGAHDRFARKAGAGACSMLANLGFVFRLDVSSVAYSWK
jgi:hypothetical protein